MAKQDKRLIQTSRELFLWRWEWERSNFDAVFEATGESETLPMHDRGHPTYKTTLHYKSFEIVWEVMIYDAALLWILGLVKTWGSGHPISLALSRPPTERRLRLLSPLTLPYEDLNTTEILQEIYRSVGYHLQKPHLHSRAMFLMLPPRTVLKLGEGHKERLLLAQVSGRIADMHGLGISKSLQDRIAMAAGFEQRKDHGNAAAAVNAFLENQLI